MEVFVIEVKVVGVALDTSNQHVVLLGKADSMSEDGPLMPIWVGAGEASSILIGAGQMNTPRPLTHDLMHYMLESLDTQVKNVEITNLDGGTFLAVIYLQSDKREHIIDARPSDAIALAVRSNAPILINEELFDSSSISELFDIESESDAGDDLESEVAHSDVPEIDPDFKDFQGFKEFLDSVSPEDFEPKTDEQAGHDSEDPDPQNAQVENTVSENTESEKTAPEDAGAEENTEAEDLKGEDPGNEAS
ncbi:MAG TPA: bifunctional nuclease domain-containing protein [Microbacteriaceae bacterium]|nr:bifunctional nuclease domain-containing protein [Microbacteriaceae bacterium]